MQCAKIFSDYVGCFFTLLIISNTAVLVPVLTHLFLIQLSAYASGRSSVSWVTGSSLQPVLTLAVIVLCKVNLQKIFYLLIHPFFLYFVYLYKFSIFKAKRKARKQRFIDNRERKWERRKKSIDPCNQGLHPSLPRACQESKALAPIHFLPKCMNRNVDQKQNSLQSN